MHHPTESPGPDAHRAFSGCPQLGNASATCAPVAAPSLAGVRSTSSSEDVDAGLSLTVDPHDPQLFELRPQIVPGNVNDR
jgi:hypothetical protein